MLKPPSGTAGPAEQGLAEAQVCLGWAYYAGWGVSQDYEESLKYYRLAAEQGDAGAYYHIANLYYHGEGVEKNINEAIRLYRLATEYGDEGAISQYTLMDLLYIDPGLKPDDDQSLEWLLKCAKNGSVTAQYKAGNLYSNGFVVMQDFVEAAMWYGKAAKEGHPTAQYRLGRLFLCGNGVPQNFAKARELFRQAADMGDQDAQYNLGTLYFSGNGVTQNYEEAYFWLSLSETSGVCIQNDVSDEIEAHLTPQQVSDVMKRVFEWEPLPWVSKPSNTTKSTI